MKTTTRIEQFPRTTATDEQAEAWYSIEAAAAAADTPLDPPPVREPTIIALRSAPHPGETRLAWLAYDSGAAVGSVGLSLIEPPNVDLGWLHVTVRPEHRRRGIGTALLEAATEAVRADGRQAVLSEVVEGSPGNYFATRHGYREVLRDSQSVTTIATIDPALLADIAGRDHRGYRLVRWTGHVPEEFVESYALAKRAMADAPTGESGWVTQPWTPTQIRDGEDRIAARGQLLTGTTALAADGTVAGLTEIVTDPRSPRRADQEDTIVVPAHRGHGIGLWMKADMIDRLRAEHPETVEISTWNAASNEYMLAINRTLGFALQTTWLNVRTELEPAGP